MGIPERTLRIPLLLLLATASVAVEPVVLENAYVRATVDPAHGGAVTSLVYKKGISFPYIAERGAGIAATGRL
ncbi:MAG: hypothetical protein ABIZ80_13455, partial [Bryobacteraceae bacterium]